MSYELFMRLSGGVVARFGYEETNPDRASEIANEITRVIEKGWSLGDNELGKVVEMSKLRVLGPSSQGDRPIIISL